MADSARSDLMDSTADVFVEEFRRWASYEGDDDPRPYLLGYVGTTLLVAYEPWPKRVPGLLVGDVFAENWNLADEARELLSMSVMEMFEPGGTRGFDFPRNADPSVIHWDLYGLAGRFGDSIPHTQDQLGAGVVPPGFISRLPVPWPGPAPNPPRHPRPPLKTVVSDLAEFGIMYLRLKLHRYRDD